MSYSLVRPQGWQSDWTRCRRECSESHSQVQLAADICYYDAVSRDQRNKSGQEHAYILCR